MPGKVLIIDDDARNIFALAATLKSRQYQSVSANSAQQGLAFLNNDAGIGIVLIDMMMPDMDGYEAIPKIKERHSVPVIAVTAQAMLGDREKCIQVGADEYISKPINVDTLFECLAKYLK